MDGSAFSFASTGSLIANLMLFAVMENVSEPAWRASGAPPYKATYATQPTGPKLIETWRPFIDAGGGGGYRRKNCPVPRDRSGAQRLADAPLPSGYDPHAPREEPFHACILVHPDGRIASVRLLGSSGSGALSAQFKATIAARWTVAGERAPGGAAWHRVRLNSGPDEGEVLEPYAIY